MKRFTGILALLFVAGMAAEGSTVPVLLVAPLDGSQEAPGPGDPDGTGKAYLAIDLEEMAVDWHIRVHNVEFPLTGAHIHEAPAGESGPIVVDFRDQLNGAGLSDDDLAAIVANPTNYYVNVHNLLFPAGAVRGQLNNPIPEPSTIGLLVVGLVSLGFARRRATRRDQKPMSDS